MADKKISQLTAATLPLAGAEELPLVQGGATKKVSVANLIVGTTGFVTARTDAAQSFTGAQSFGNTINLTNSTNAKINFATVSSSTTNYIQTHSDGYSLMAYVDRGVSKPSYLMNFGGTHEWGFAGTSSLELDVTNKNLTVKTGNLVIGTSGKGIDFSATGQATGMTSELLSDYEEGTFTPVVYGTTAAGVGTYSIQKGYYTKIGRLVQIHIDLAWSAHTGTGFMLISGLPFTSNASATANTFSTIADTMTFSNSLGTLLNSNGSIIQLITYASGGSFNLITMDTAVGELIISGSYIV